jgi:hypothetical protein
MDFIKNICEEIINDCKSYIINGQYDWTKDLNKLNIKPSISSSWDNRNESYILYNYIDSFIKWINDGAFLQNDDKHTLYIFILLLNFILRNYRIDTLKCGTSYDYSCWGYNKLKNKLKNKKSNLINIKLLKCKLFGNENHYVILINYVHVLDLYLHKYYTHDELKNELYNIYESSDISENIIDIDTIYDNEILQRLKSHILENIDRYFKFIQNTPENIKLKKKLKTHIVKLKL